METALLYIPMDCFGIAHRVVEVPIIRNTELADKDDRLACPRRLVHQARKIEVYRSGKFAYMMKEKL